jgi:hypothetical protein
MTNQEAGAALPIVQTLRVAPFPAAREAADTIEELVDMLKFALQWTWGIDNRQRIRALLAKLEGDA